MLEEIRVENLLILSRAHVALHPGLNVISGETGVGKSLLLSAVGALFGERLGEGGRPDEPTLVEGRFQLGEAERGLVAEDLGEDGELVIRVTRKPGGAQRSYLNGRLASRDELRRLAGRLVDVHGQRDLQRLLQAREQVAVLDLFGGTLERAAAFAAAHAEVLQLESAAARRSAREAELSDQLDLARFQLRELEEADPRPGEAEELSARHRMLRAAETVARSAGSAAEAVTGEDGALDRLRRAGAELRRAGDDDPEALALAERVWELAASAEDLGRELDALAADRAALDEDPEVLRERLDLLNALMRKHRGDEQALVERRAALEEQIRAATAEAEGLEALEDRIAAARLRRLELGRVLAKERGRAGRRLAKAVEKELAVLKMPRARFRVDAGEAEAALESPRRVDALGFGNPRFELMANPGGDFADLADSASGGELSRVLLALKSTLAETQRMPLLIFDEIESGVGPRLGSVLGERLARLGRHRQVLCITHFPQIAVHADRHLALEKGTRGKRTVTEIREVEGAARIQELADMLGGAERDLALDQARGLLRAAGRAGGEIGVEEAP